jgi:MoxR-like ATPase
MTTTTPTKLLTQYQDIAEFLKSQNVERDEDIDLLLLSTVSGVDALFLGDPGVGKTWMIELLVNYCLTDMSLFSHLFAKDQSADEVLGPRDIMAMKNGVIARLTDGYMPDANYAYADEVFKASPPMLNPLLDLLANRVLKVGGNVKDCGQLISILMSSNELPDREDLLAFRDRIGITKYVQPVRTPEGRRRVTDIQLDFQANGLDTSTLTPLTLAEIHAIRAEVKQVVVNDACRQIMVDAQQKWTEAGHPPSQRRIGQMWKVIKAHAWAHSRSEVVADDFLPCQHMAWNHPDDADSARSVILEFASVFTRKAQRAREAMEPIAQSMEELRSKLEAADTESDRDDLMTDGFKFIRQLRKLGRDVDQQLAEGRDQGQDVSMLTELRTDISKLDEWAEKALVGED